MEDLEKQNCCDCCDECKCENCNCTADSKCCDDCACDTSITKDDNCQSNNDEVYESENVQDCDDCENIDDNRQDCENVDEINDNLESDKQKCKCGCGGEVEESTADAYFSQLLSLRAEFDNYRKRTQSDIAKAYSNGFNQAITEFLPALDSFKMATEYITDPNTLMGIQYIEKGILSTLEKIGVKAIDVSGKFNPNFHQAIGSEVSPDFESGDIIKECFKGFTMGDKVIRYSQVIVAK